MTLSMAGIAYAAGLGLAVAFSLGVMLLVLWRPWRPVRRPDLILPTEPPPPPLSEARALQAWMVTLAPGSGTAAAPAAPDATSGAASDIGASIIPLFPDAPAPDGSDSRGNTQPHRRRA